MGSEFPQEWSLVPLEECMEEIIDYRGKTPRKSASGIPLITAKIIKGGRILEPDEFIPFEDYDERMQRGIPKAGDVVITTEAPLGEVGQLDGRKLSVGQRIITLRGKNEILDNTYLKFLMQSDFVQNQLKARATGTTVIGIKQKELRQITLVRPAFSEQRAIAVILGALDDKIELNRRISRTLEGVAKVLFRHWLVSGTEAGWETRSIGYIAENIRLSAQPNEIEATTPYIGLEHMPRRSIALAEWGQAEQVTSNKSWFKRGEVLFGKLRPYFHKVGVAPIDGVCSTDILVIAPKSPEWFGLMLMHLSSDALVAYTSNSSTGTKMPRTSWNDIARYEILVPPIKSAKAFNDQIQPLIEKIRTNIFQSRILSELRDTLLPKLLSGEVRVRDADQFIARQI
jgi:type I restriction enzyme, S subunit